MAKGWQAILELPWEQQAAYLQGLSRRELEILWFQMQTHRERVDLLYLAVYSILRDLYEAESKSQNLAAAWERAGSQRPV